MGQLRSLPYRKLADALHSVAPVLAPEVRQHGRRSYVLGAHVSPRELLLVELRHRAGWWAMAVIVDPDTGQASNELDDVMFAAESEHPIAAQAHEISAVAIHVITLATSRWQQISRDPNTSPGEGLWAQIGLKELDERGLLD
jgi:hypothetical protein